MQNPVIIEAAYDSALRLANTRRFSEALDILESLGNYRDSQALARYCRTLMDLEAAVRDALSEEDGNQDGAPDPWRGLELCHMLGAGGRGYTFLMKRQRSDSPTQYRVLKLCPIDSSAPPFAHRPGQYRDADSMTLELAFEPFIMGRLSDCPNIAAIEDWDIVGEDGSRCILMLTQALLPLSRYRGGDVVRLGVEICSALAALHARAVRHGDVRFDNILLDRDGQFRLGDFSSARLLSMAASGIIFPTFPETTIRLGWEYPHSADDHANSIFSGDLFGLGMVLARMYLESRDRQSGNALPAFTGDISALLESRRQDFLETAVGRCILQAISPEYEQRFTTAAEMKAALLCAAALDGDPRFAGGDAPESVAPACLPGELRGIQDEFDRFTQCDRRSLLMVEYQSGLCRLFDGSPVAAGDLIALRILHRGCAAPSSITLELEKTVFSQNEGLRDPDRRYRCAAATPAASAEWLRALAHEDSIALDWRHFDGCDRAVILAEYPDGFQGRWSVPFIQDSPAFVDDSRPTV